MDGDFNMTIWGTSYFVNFASAVRYYKPYGYDKQGVHGLKVAGLIHLGKPELKEGEKLILLDDNTRYGIKSEA